MAQDGAILTISDQYEVVYDLSISAIFNGLERPLTHILRSCQYLMLNMSLVVQDRHIFRPTLYKW